MGDVFLPLIAWQPQCREGSRGIVKVITCCLIMSWALMIFNYFSEKCHANNFWLNKVSYVSMIRYPQLILGLYEDYWFCLTSYLHLHKISTKFERNVMLQLVMLHSWLLLSEECFSCFIGTDVQIFYIFMC